MTPSAVGRRTENLALVLQEVLTAIVRLRSNRQAVSDANSFRIHMREALKSADQEARKRGYSGDTIQLAIFAVVAFLDESILNSRNPLFADWPRKPLQEELVWHPHGGRSLFPEPAKAAGPDGLAGARRSCSKSTISACCSVSAGATAWEIKAICAPSWTRWPTRSGACAAATPELSPMLAAAARGGAHGAAAIRGSRKLGIAAIACVTLLASAVRDLQTVAWFGGLGSCAPWHFRGTRGR